MNDQAEVVTKSTSSLAYIVTIGGIAIVSLMVYNWYTAPPPHREITEKEMMERFFPGIDEATKKEVRDRLDKHGVKGEVLSIRAEGQEAWLVDVGRPVAPGKKQPPSPPTPYRIDRKTGEITRY